LVTVRVRSDIPSLRTVRVVQELESSFRGTLMRKAFRITHYSVQRDHLHLLVESEDASALSRGMKSLCARLARVVNRVFARSGPVLDGRYHQRALGTPREVRNAFAYVLLNSQKHAGNPGAAIDPASSGRWFDGWARSSPPASDHPAVARPETWLLKAGWRRHGLIRLDEVPGEKRRLRA
jgi:REP element-mobilizing transposase RayT